MLQIIYHQTIINVLFGPGFFGQIDMNKLWTNRTLTLEPVDGYFAVLIMVIQVVLYTKYPKNMQMKK